VLVPDGEENAVTVGKIRFAQIYGASEDNSHPSTLHVRVISKRKYISALARFSGGDTDSSALPTTTV